MSAPRLLEMPAFSEFIARMTARGAAPAVISKAGELSYAELLRASDQWIDRLQEHGVGAGTVCGYIGEFSPETIALFIALMRRRAIAVPLTQNAEPDFDRFAEIAGIERLIRFDREGPIFSDLGYRAIHLRETGPEPCTEIRGDPTYRDLDFLFVPSERWPDLPPWLRPDP